MAENSHFSKILVCFFKIIFWSQRKIGIVHHYPSLSCLCPILGIKNILYLRPLTISVNGLTDFKKTEAWEPGWVPLGGDFTEGGKPENPEKNPRSTQETHPATV